MKNLAGEEQWPWLHIQDDCRCEAKLVDKKVQVTMWGGSTHCRPGDSYVEVQRKPEAVGMHTLKTTHMTRQTQIS